MSKITGGGDGSVSSVSDSDSLAIMGGGGSVVTFFCCRYFYIAIRFGKL